MKREQCCICLSNLDNIYKLDNIPIKLECISTYIECLETLSFSQCITCNTIQLDKLIPLNVLYSESHNYSSVGITWNNYFKLFIDTIAPIIIGKNILEIGCPSGKIALKSKDYKHWYIVEPNKNPNITFDDSITFIENFFDNTLKIDDKIDVIIHSHLFEHIYEPSKFLINCSEILNEEGVMFFGIPNMEYLSETNICPFLGVFFEHTIFLNKQNTAHLLTSHNFEIIEIIEYEKHSILFHCKKNSNLNKSENFSIANLRPLFFTTLQYFEMFIKRCNDIINISTKYVYIFSASYNTQIILSMGLNKSKITGILDNCNEKQGKYLYGFNLNIFDPSVIIDKDCIVIIKNGYYMNEVLSQIMDINKNTEIII